MNVRCRVRARFPVPPDVLFDFTNRAENFRSFTGYGPIPGIRSAAYVTAGEPRRGSVRRIVKTDGTEHLEEIVAFERPRRHTSLVTGLTPPFSWLVRSGEDDWLLHADGTGTEVHRTFSFELVSPLVAPVALAILHLFMRPAIRRDLENIAASLSDGR